VTVRFLLDTSVISAPISKTPNPTVIANIRRHSDQCAIAAPVWHELTYGSRRLAAGKRRDAIVAYLNDVVRPSFPILPYDERAAAWHGEERARLERAGKTAPYVDGQIAAIARVNGLVLVTANTGDFSGFQGLEIADWQNPA